MQDAEQGMPLPPPYGLPSVYYAEADVSCPIDEAWRLMLDYQSWNPDFANARVTTIAGQRQAEGEVVTIQIMNPAGDVLAQFYAHTVKVVPQRHFVWYTYTGVQGSFHNFIDFELAESVSGCRFRINFYAQNLLSADALAAHREKTQNSLVRLAAAFKNFCEARAGS